VLALALIAWTALSARAAFMAAGFGGRTTPGAGTPPLRRVKTSQVRGPCTGSVNTM
jgi:hypothetical protein